MFTGLIRHRGILINSVKENELLILEIENLELAKTAKVKDSINVNGICLTISEIKNNLMSFELVEETQKRTTAIDWTSNQFLHLEPAMSLSDRLDGHLVSGHIDTTVSLIEKIEQPDALILWFKVPAAWNGLLIEKGSVAIDGVSLTVAQLLERADDSVDFSVWLIPTTVENTNFSQLKVGDKVNIEFDLVAKYILKNLKRTTLES
ncbi:MAG: riboflavin synthase [Candidatus Nanopelagicales bacterium]